MRRLALVLALAAGIAMLTMLVAWWMVPVAGAAWTLWRRGQPAAALEAGIAAAVAWGALLLVVAVRGPVAQVATQVGGVVGVPGAVLVLLTLLFPFALAWSAARLAMALGAGSPRQVAMHDEAGRGSIPAARLTGVEAERIGAD